MRLLDLGPDLHSLLASAATASSRCRSGGGTSAVEVELRWLTAAIAARRTDARREPRAGCGCACRRSCACRHHQRPDERRFPPGRATARASAGSRCRSPRRPQRPHAGKPQAARHARATCSRTSPQAHHGERQGPHARAHERSCSTRSSAAACFSPSRSRATTRRCRRNWASNVSLSPMRSPPRSTSDPRPARSPAPAPRSVSASARSASASSACDVVRRGLRPLQGPGDPAVEIRCAHRVRHPSEIERRICRMRVVGRVPVRNRRAPEHEPPPHAGALLAAGADPAPRKASPIGALHRLMRVKGPVLITDRPIARRSHTVRSRAARAPPMLLMATFM